jgi:hypothetical protein
MLPGLAQLGVAAGPFKEAAASLKPFTGSGHPRPLHH